MYPRIGIKKMVYICTILALIFIPSRMVDGANFEAQKEALKEIADFADRICIEYTMEGHNERMELSGKAKVELNNLLKKIADMGIEGAGKYQTETWQGVIQKDLKDLLNNAQNCRLEVWRDLKDKLLAANSVQQSENDNRIIQHAEKVASYYVTRPIV